MNPPNTNLRAFQLAVQTLLKSPAQFLPHLTIPTITSLPEQLGPALQQALHHEKAPNEKDHAITIRALVLDKDNTLCPSKTTTLPTPIYEKLHHLRTSPTSPFNRDAHPDAILIVSNRAGSHPRYDAEIADLEDRLASLRIPVFRLPAGCEKKPFCGEAVVRWFRERGVVTRADEIAVVGDRLGTDVLMAARMGSWSVWCRDGIAEGGDPRRNVLEKMEVWVERYLRESRGLKAPPPAGWNRS
ncbi:hypothetical protein HFD88_006223 [Aspergillus terreus]|nr:hypothetical protein HFD88_006223 [Aspergillus terreus]